MENELSRVIDALPGLVWTALPDGHIDFLNQRWCEYTGLAVDEAYGRGWQSAIHPEDLPELLERWRSVLASGEAGEMEARVRRFDGEYRWFLFRACPVPDASGQVVKWCGLNTDIQDRKQAEEAQQAREDRFGLIVDGLPTLVILMGPDGELQHANRHCLEFFGATLEELQGRGQVHSYHPDDRPAVLAAWKKSLETGQPYESEGRRLRADGVYRWFQTRGFPLRDAEGRIVLWYSLATDIDDRRRAEEALRASERNLRLIINTIPALAWSARPDGTAEFFNQHYLDYMGLSAKHAQGWGWTAAVHPDDLNGLATTWQTILASGMPGEAEARLLRHDGDYRWFLFRTNPLRDESGNIVKWYGINTDIEERKRAEESLSASERYSRLIVDSIPGMVAVFTPGGEVEAVNHQVLEYFGTTEEEQKRWATGNAVHPEDLPRAIEFFTRSLASGDPFDFEVRARRFDGVHRWFQSRGFPLQDTNGRIVRWYNLLIDIDERKRAEEALSKARSELAHVARVTSLGALTASIAHEVNQPLSGIITNASTCLRMLAADPPNVDGARETARRTIRDGNRASDVITRLRALFAKKDVTTETVDLNEATREVIALSSSDLQRNRVVLRAELNDALPPVIGDRVQLQQVILNLIRNASDAMSSVDDRPRQLVIRTERDEDARVRLIVQDSGAGFDTQTKGRLFEAFYTTKSNGMGVGLSVSRSIIERHNGRLWAAPNDGPGVSFSFSIPREPERVSEPTSGAIRTPAEMALDPIQNVRAPAGAGYPAQNSS